MSSQKNVKQRKCPTNVQLFSKMTVRRIRRVRPSVRRLQRLIIKQYIWRIRRIRRCKPPSGLSLGTDGRTNGRTSSNQPLLASFLLASGPTDGRTNSVEHASTTTETSSTEFVRPTDEFRRTCLNNNGDKFDGEFDGDFVRPSVRRTRKEACSSRIRRVFDA